jgi:hypothetical protein
MREDWISPGEMVRLEELSNEDLASMLSLGIGMLCGLLSKQSTAEGLEPDYDAASRWYDLYKEIENRLNGLPQSMPLEPEPDTSAA